MSNLAEQLMESASAVAVLGSERTDFAALDDASVTGGMSLVSELRRSVQAYELLLSAEISRRSSHEFGNSGLARRNGAATPAVFIQSITGSSIDEATKLARLGSMIADSGNVPPDEGSEPALVSEAVLAGEISTDAAEAIRKGLGRPDDAITLDAIRGAERDLLEKAGTVSPEALLKLARIARGQLDLDAVAEGQKQRSDLRYVRRWRRDGLSGGSWCLPDEDGGADIDNVLQLLVAASTGGPRFPQTDADGNEIVKTTADIAVEDHRSPDQLRADGFAQIMLNGLRVDPSVVPGAGRAPVRVIVTEKVLVDERGSALVDDSLSPITFSKLEEHLCEGGQVGILFDQSGTVLDLGREQRLFTGRQRTALGIRDGGCRYPGCDKPPSWTEAHHIRQWARDGGETDIANGILLCRYHHMFIHETAAEIVIDRGRYWLRPGKSLDPHQTLIEMPSKNPLSPS